MSHKKDRPKIQNNELGIGYVKPISMPASSFNHLVKIWRKKLAKSGFNDIEVHDSQTRGKVLPYFNQGKNSLSIPVDYDASAEYYYRLAREFTHACNWKATFADEAKTLNYIWQMYSEGVPYRQMLVALAGKRVKPKHAHNCPPVPKSIKQVRGVWWVHKQVHKVLKHFNAWRADYAHLDK